MAEVYRLAHPSKKLSKNSNLFSGASAYPLTQPDPNSNHRGRGNGHNHRYAYGNQRGRGRGDQHQNNEHFDGQNSANNRKGFGRGGKGGRGNHSNSQKSDSEIICELCLIFEFEFG